MNILISGAGPAGLTAAYWLRRYGFTPTVVERAPSLVVVGWLLKQLMRMEPGRMAEWIINRSTERITRAANAIRLKDYSSFVRSNEATTP